MTGGGSKVHYFPYLGGCLCVAGIVHIVSILALPYLAERDAFSRLEKSSAINSLTLLPQPVPNSEILPMGDPALASALCRYDISLAPFRISAAVPTEGLLSISFHDRYGRVYYSLTDRAAVRGRIEAVVVTADQKEALEADDNEDGPGPDLRLVTQLNEGFVLLRVLAEHPGDYARNRQILQNITCTSEPG